MYLNLNLDTKFIIEEIMTIQQSLDIVDGSVTPSTDVLDASLLEISSETNNLLQVKEAGTLYVRGVLK